MDAEFWNDRYSADGYHYGEKPNGFLSEMVSHIPSGPVLCLAEGEGRNAVHLATLGHQVTAVDQSEVGLFKARRLAEAKGVKIFTVVADLAHFEMEPNFWAGIVAIFSHLPPVVRRRVFGDAVRGLRSGGVFILEA